uniref:Pregnancy-zone protein n=1 Tax=Xenopus tropicalis TaxID=8364 RepID=A0A6I8RH41_XENTR
MLLRALHVGLLLLQLSGALGAKLQYAVIFPSEMVSPQSEQACVHLEGADGGSRIHITLEMGKRNTTVLEKTSQQKSYFRCITFEVPPPTNGNEEVATMQVSIESGGETISNSRRVLVKRARTSLFVQTDKAVYKPGQTVRFRVVSLKENLQPEESQVPTIELQDPGKNRIGQWLNVSLQQGIAELSLPLSSEPSLGEYSIRVKDTVHRFSVEEYVLPRFEVTLQLPRVVAVNSKQFAVNICARYTYGKPVQGTYKVNVCRKHYSYRTMVASDQGRDLCADFSGTLSQSGCSTLDVQSSTYNLLLSEWQLNLEGTGSVLEDGTGIEISASGRSQISSQLTTVTFLDADDTYKPGISYIGTVKVVDASDTPIPNQTVYLTSLDGMVNQTLETDENGLAPFKLENTAEWKVKVFLTAKIQKEEPLRKYQYGVINPSHGSAFLTISRFHSLSNSFLKLYAQKGELLCEGQQEVRVEYLIKRTVLEEGAKHLELHYLTVSKGAIKDCDFLEVPINNEDEVLRGEVSIKLDLSADVSPTLRVLTYILLPGGDMPADSATFKLQRCFRNKVSVGFSPDEVLPGADVSLQVQAAAGSLCGLRVVDQSVVLMKPDKELTANKIHDLFPSRDFGNYDYRIQEYDDHCPFFPYWRPWNRFFKRSIQPWHFPEERDVYSLFKKMRIKIITNADIKKPVECQHYDFRGPGLPGMPGIPGDRRVVMASPSIERDVMVGAAMPDTIQQPEPEAAEIIRTYFPETWIWELAPVGESGRAEVHGSAPDTITEWNAGAFCMGPSGFGISPPTSLRVFQPFFVELALPYSVVRGESFTLKATVFNYLKQCIKVQTILLPSQELELEPCADCQYSSCLCAEESKTFYWNLKASNLGEVNVTVKTEALDTQDLCNNEFPIVPKQGRSDTVVKPLLVQPGGVLIEKSHSSLLCCQAGEDHPKTEEISLKVPENILKDSERAYATVLGDLMGTAMQNLGRLLAMPYGCGEQNMALFAPNIFILQYLTKTRQLTPEVQSKAKGFLESGYQRQLTYKRNDGSYSAFGQRDKEGNTWLTAFVVNSFSKARPYIFIDESHLNHSFSWLRDNRNESGCFRSVGRLFNNALKGGIDDETSLSTYVTMALLEAGVSVQDPVVADALSCLRKAAKDVSSVYTQALLAYTFTLSKDIELREMLLAKLEEKAVRNEGQLHWERKPATVPSALPYWYRAPSAEVELTSYVLLAHLSGPNKDLGKASEIVNWLSKQQNPYGGFSSTQDTVVALQALAKYGEATFTDKGDVTATVTSKTGFHQQFHVDQTNRLLLQKASLPDIPGEYSLSATGSGCVYVQTVLRYNIPPPRSDATFSVRVETEPDKCPQDQLKVLKISMTAQYTGSREKSNMAVIECKMLSGFIPVKSSVRELEKSKTIKRSEILTEKVTLYLDELGHEPLHLSFMVEQDIVVKNLKPATVKVYDYYDTEEEAVAEYNSPCGSDGDKGNAK